MNIIYRMCPEGNPNKHRPDNMTKMETVKTCYKSVLKAFPNAHITFIIDKPNVEIMELVEECPNKHDYEIFHFESWNDGNVGTFHRQLDLAQDMGKVLLLEDDYFFIPDAETIIENALDEFEFITPYDHPGYYTEAEHDYKREVELAGGRHWQTVSSTCLTFASTGERIKAVIDTMKKFGWQDHFMWLELTQEHKLWSPIPSVATHMEVEYLAPYWRFPK